MRMRRGLTQAQTAAQLGMTRQAILRWETGKSLPTGDNLARLCAVLQAYPAEQQTLATGHWPALALRPEMSLDASVEAVETFGRVINGSDPSLADLYALALKRHLRLQCERSEQAVSLLAQTEHLHSLWLNRQGRRAEAQANLNWVLQRMRAAPNPEPFWDGALNLASLFAVIQKQSGGGERLTRQWLPRLPDGYLKLARLCDMAFYAAQDNRTEIAWEYLADAERQMWMRNAESDKAEKYLEVTRIRLLMMQGDTDAQAWLLRTAPSAYVRQDRMLGWAITLLKFGERNAAHRTLVEMESQIAPESIPTRRKGYASLVKKFGTGGVNAPPSSQREGARSSSEHQTLV